MLSLNILSSTISGILIFLSLSAKRPDLVIILLPLLILNFLFTSRKYKIYVVIIFIVSLLTSYFNFSPYLIDKIPSETKESTTIIYGKVEGFSSESYNPKSFIMANIRIGEKRYAGNLKVYIDYEPPTAYSSVIVKGKIKFTENSSFIESIVGYDYYIFPDTLSIVKVNRFFSFIAKVRNSIIENIKLSMKSSESFLLLSSIFGISSMSNEEKEPYINTGTAHIFAISGLHVGILGETLRSFLSKFTLFSPFITIIFLLLYLLLIGFKVSALRAFIMYSITLFSKFLGTGHNSLNSLFVSAFFVLIVFPSSILSLSFYLSFMAVFALLVVPELVSKNFPRGKLISLFSQLVSVQLFISPLIANYFNIVSLSAFVANLIVIPFLYVLVPAGFVQIVFSAFTINLAKIFAPVSNFLFEILNKFVVFVSNFNFSHFYVSSNIFKMVIQYGVAGVFIFSMYKRNNRTAVVALIVFIFTFLVSFGYGSAFSHAYSFQGENLLFFHQGSTNIIVLSNNGGELEEKDYNLLRQALIKNGVNIIDGLIVTHNLSSNEWSFAIDLLNDRTFKVENVFAYGSQDFYANLPKSVQINVVKENDTINLHTIKVKIMSSSVVLIESPDKKIAFISNSSQIPQYCSDYSAIYVPQMLFSVRDINPALINKILVY